MGPIADFVAFTIEQAVGRGSLIGATGGDWHLIRWEKAYVADIAHGIGANITAAVRATVADALATAGV